MNNILDNSKLITFWHDFKGNTVYKVKDSTGVHDITIKQKNYFFIDLKDYDKIQDVLNKCKIIIDDRCVNCNKRQKKCECGNKYHPKSDVYTVNYNISIEGNYVKIEYLSINSIMIRILQANLITALNNANIKHYELDLLPGDNYIIDNKWDLCEDYRILYFDIETKDTVGGIEIGRDRILSICAVDNTGKEYIFCDDDELKILNNFSALLNQHDIIIGWNSEKFDKPYVEERFKINNIYFNFNSIIHIDLMKVFMDSFAVKTRIGKKFMRSFSLDNVAREFLDSSKLDIKEGGGEGYGGRLWNLFNTNRQLLIDYNLQDCKLLKQLDEAFNLIKNEIEVAKIVGAPLSRTRSLISMIDYLLIRESRKMGIHAKTKPYGVEKAEYPGGHVIEPIPGMYTNVHIFDFASLYPNIFRVFNLSPDTLLEHYEPGCITTPNLCYFSKKDGLVPKVLDTLTVLRLEYKDKQNKLKKEGKTEEALVMEFIQTAVKVVILSIYGITGSAFSRFFDIKVASSVTLTGQALLKNVAKRLNEKGFNVVTGDTDSCMFQIHDRNRYSEVVNEIIPSAIQEIVTNSGTHKKNTLKMEFEKSFENFVVLAKKKYVGRCIKEGERDCDFIYFKGVEVVKASELKLTKELLDEIYNMTLIKKVTVSELKAHIYARRKEILDKKLTDINKITIIKKVGRMPEEYKNLPAHVKLAVERKEKGERFYTSMKVPFIVVSEKPLKIVHVEDYSGEYDVNYYWCKHIYPPTYRYLKTIYPLENWDKYLEVGNDYQNTLLQNVVIQNKKKVKVKTIQINTQSKLLI